MDTVTKKSYSIWGKFMKTTLTWENALLSLWNKWNWSKTAHTIRMRFFVYHSRSIHKFMNQSQIWKTRTLLLIGLLIHFLSWMLSVLYMQILLGFLTAYKSALFFWNAIMSERFLTIKHMLMLSPSLRHYKNKAV